MYEWCIWLASTILLTQQCINSFKLNSPGADPKANFQSWWVFWVALIPEQSINFRKTIDFATLHCKLQVLCSEKRIQCYAQNIRSRWKEYLIIANFLEFCNCWLQFRNDDCKMFSRKCVCVCLANFLVGFISKMSDSMIITFIMAIGINMFDWYMWIFLFCSGSSNNKSSKNE